MASATERGRSLVHDSLLLSVIFNAMVAEEVQAVLRRHLGKRRGKWRTMPDPL
jgi:hypothetical protein